MEHIRAPKTEDVVCWRKGKSVAGTLLLTMHHVTFQYMHTDPGASNASPPPKPSFKETWIPYPMINFCSYRPSPHASHQPPSIRLRCRDFNFIAFHFKEDSQAQPVFESIRRLTCRLESVDKLYAFTYRPSAAERSTKGWSIYNPVLELERMGITQETRQKTGWRLSSINAKFEYCATYPAVLCVPHAISDTTLKHMNQFRSKSRIPVLSYMHSVNNCTITRSAQPLAGLSGKRNAQDEALVAAIFGTTAPSTKPFHSAPATPRTQRSNADLSGAAESLPSDLETLRVAPVTMEDSMEAISSSQSSTEPNGKPSKVYGAQQNNIIVDARPQINAIANHAVGAGSENMSGYKTAKRAFLSIENIHVMRNSLQDVVDAMKDSDLTTFPPNQMLLQKSGWKQHIGSILSGARVIADTIALQHSHVLIHCSDGWDRTSQLSALAQLCLDPYYRSMNGFMVLVEKDWLSFGHMFRTRSGLLSHENWFEVQNDRSAGNRNSTGGDMADSPSNPFEKAITKAQDMWRRRHEGSGELDADSDSVESSPAPKRNPKMDTKLKDTSPIFHQFLDAVHQLQRQFPTRFEFNERFLRRLLYHVYSCQYGTFLYDCEKERVESRAKDRTRSVWEYFLTKRQQFLNDNYDPIIDDNDRDRTSLILPDSSNVRWWHEVFGKKDEEMNLPETAPLAPLLPTWDGATEMEHGEESEQGFGTVSQAGVYGMEGQASARSSTVNRFARMDNSRHEDPVVTDPLSGALFANDGLERDDGTRTDPLTSGPSGSTTTRAGVEMR